MPALENLDRHASVLAKLAAEVIHWRQGEGMDESFTRLTDFIAENEDVICAAARYFGQSV